MLARQKWQIATISILEDVFADRVDAVDSGYVDSESLPGRQEEIEGRSLAEQIAESDIDAEALIQLAALCVALVEDRAREEE